MAKNCALYVSKNCAVLLAEKCVLYLTIYIRIGIITNHNKFDIGEYKALRKEAKKRDILILPGVELSIKEGSNGLHTLIVFNPEEWIEGD